jgi:ribose transport system permease protein
VGVFSRVFGNPLVRALLALVLIVFLGFMFSADPLPTDDGGYAFFSSDGAFFKWTTHRDMLRQVSVYGILACGMTLVILTGGIDLSVGSVLGLTAVSFSILSIHMGLPALIALPACLLLGAGMGAVSGTLIARFSLQPFIATLAMMVFARGLAKYVSGGQKISNYIQKEDFTTETLDMPKIFDLLDQRILGGNITVVTIIFLACVIVSWVVISRLRVGRYLYALGGNEEAARLSGVPVGKVKVLAYALSGMFAAIAGICQAAQEYQGDPEAGATYELTAIAIVVIGGTSLMGGRGGVLLTLVGTLTIGYLDKILSINAVGEASRLMLTGAIIVGAVMLQRQRRAA